MITVYVHLSGLENTLMEVEALPEPSDNMIVGHNPRRRDGKDIPFLLPEVNKVIFTLNTVLFIEIIPTGEEQEIETFIRE